MTEKNVSPTLVLDLKDPTYGALSLYAGRIGKLLASPTVRASPELAGSLDDFLGAVYALIQAKRYDFADRIGPIEIAAVEKRAKKIASGEVRVDGKWIAGFYFNNALFRTAAIQHRILKIIVGKDNSVPKLQEAAKVVFPKWTSDKLKMVHDQVNGLKHEPRGIHDALRANIGETNSVRLIKEQSGKENRNEQAADEWIDHGVGSRGTERR